MNESFNIGDKNIFISGLGTGTYGALRYFILHTDYFNTAGSTSRTLEIDYPNFQKVSQLFWQRNWMSGDLAKNIGNLKTGINTVYQYFWNKTLTSKNRSFLTAERKIFYIQIPQNWNTKPTVWKFRQCLSANRAWYINRNKIEISWQK